MDWLNKFMFIVDFIEGIEDVFETWKEKDEKIWIKIICSIITIGFIILSAKLWLK